MFKVRCCRAMIDNKISKFIKIRQFMLVEKFSTTGVLAMKAKLFLIYFNHTRATLQLCRNDMAQDFNELA